MSTISLVKAALPDFAFRPIRNSLWRLTKLLAKSFGQTMTKRGDFSSPVPDVGELARNQRRWDRPGSMPGVQYNLDEMKALVQRLLESYQAEFNELPAPAEVLTEGYGWGYPAFDTMMLYMMLRELKPRRYIEIGSGMSTLYCTFAAKKNAAEGSPMEITCIEPYPSQKLKAMPGITLKVNEVQDVPPEFFSSLGDGDVLFIDSSHVVKIDGDVPHLYLQVLPTVAKGVYIHCHDMPFPYSTPYPSDLWILNGQDFEMFWTEAMILQAFLCFNDSFQIVASTPMIRHFDEEFLRSRVKNYQGVNQEKNTFSCFWMRRTK